MGKELTYKSADWLVVVIFLLFFDFFSSIGPKHAMYFPENKNISSNLVFKINQVLYTWKKEEERQDISQSTDTQIHFYTRNINVTDGAASSS